jgi:elongation factor P
MSHASDSGRRHDLGARRALCRVRVPTATLAVPTATLYSTGQFPKDPVPKMPKINGNEIRPGYILEHDGGLWVAVKVNHVKPGKGGAFAQVEMKNIRDGRKLNERFRSADKVERVRLDQKDQQFLYESDGLLHFMDADTFEQVTIPADIFGERRPFLQDGMTIQVEYYEDEALNAMLPDKVTCTVVETEPAVKGQTAANSFNPAILDNGVRIMIPPFVGEGEAVVVSTETMDYVERA